MATYTDNLHLEKPAQSDLYDISVFNGNADIIDSAMAARALAQNQATIEASSTASRNYAKGDFLVRNGLLYKVTSAITSGGTITPGTNCVATDTGAELKSLNTECQKLESNFAVIQASNVATQAFAIGDYLTYQGELYKVTSAIANGGTITPGTNCTKTDVGTQLKAQNDSFTNYITPTNGTAYNANHYMAINASYTKIGRVCVASITMEIGNTITSGSTQVMILDMPVPLKDATFSFSIAAAKYTILFNTAKSFTFRPLDNFGDGYSGSCTIIYLTAA